MAGYIFSLDSVDALDLYTTKGVYATKLSPPSGYWRTYHEGTFADYATMKEGDNVYFFIQRKIYGVGKLVNVGADCKYLNYPEAGKPRRFRYQDRSVELLWDEGEFSIDQRCVCFFEPDPCFFRLGIDMDDVLSSNPAAFKMLRAFQRLSFIKFDDEENQAFRDIILNRNKNTLLDPERMDGVFPLEPCHEQVAALLPTGAYGLGPGIADVLSSCANDDVLRHEMAIETGLLYQLAAKEPLPCDLFGEWDYLSHQVIASPFKPIHYMDKMDLFGYAYIPGFRPTRSRYLVGEIKKDAARFEDIDQLLKYVDWVRDEYCHGDYSMIDAFLVAYSFDQAVLAHKQEVGVRQYTVGVRPATSQEWSNVTLVSYSFDASLGHLRFQLAG
jgi:hypothetical protein